MGALAAPIVGGAASAFVGGLMSKKSGGGGGGYQPVGPQFGDVLPHAMPWGVNVMGLGGTMTDETGRVVGTYMDPRLQAIANNLYQRAGEQTGAISGTMPQEIGTQYYEQFLAPQLAKSREQQELGLEKRLLAQGMLGSTGGALRQQALGEALSANELQALGQSMQMGQNWYDLMRQREMQDIQNMMQMYNAPAQQLGLGAQIGSNIGAVASGIKPAMVQTPPSGGFGSGLFGTLAGPLSQYAGKAAGDWASGYFGGSGYTEAPYLDPGFAYESSITDSSYYG
jgi:hypothetical protein